MKVKPSKTHRPKKTTEKKDKTNFFQNQFEILQENEPMEESPTTSYDVEGPPGIPIPSTPTMSTRRFRKNKPKAHTDFDMVTSYTKESTCQCCSQMCLLEVDSEEMATNIEQMEEDPGMDIDAVKEADEEGNGQKKCPGRALGFEGQ